jgi:hypothetical protein
MRTCSWKATFWSARILHQPALTNEPRHRIWESCEHEGAQIIRVQPLSPVDSIERPEVWVVGQRFAIWDGAEDSVSVVGVEELPKSFTSLLHTAGGCTRWRSRVSARHSAFQQHFRCNCNSRNVTFMESRAPITWQRKTTRV